VARSKTSSGWLREHFDDQYVKMSQKDGYRSRASYKLLEIDKKDKILRPGSVVIDLGAAPGGWTQVVAEKVGPSGIIVASDILPMDALADVEFIQGDFTEQEVLDQILETMGDRKADLVISDMAPNMSGMSSVDIPKAMYLVELSLDLAKTVLKPGGDFVAKVFQGEGFTELLEDMRGQFSKVVSRKPEASRARSKEVYQVCKGFRG